MNQALGLLETKGLIGAIEAADAMVKAADVTIVSKEKSTAALVTIKIIGDTSAVRAALDAGAVAADKVGQLVSVHLIPRPDDQIKYLISNTDKVAAKPVEENYPSETVVETLENEYFSKESEIEKPTEEVSDEVIEETDEVIVESEEKEKFEEESAVAIEIPEEPKEIVPEIKEDKISQEETFDQVIESTEEAEKIISETDEKEISEEEKSDDSDDEPSESKNLFENFAEKEESDIEEEIPEAKTPDIPSEEKPASPQEQKEVNLFGSEDDEETESLIIDGAEIPPLEELENLSVPELRKLARSVDNFPIKGREISKANKQILLSYFKML